MDILKRCRKCGKELPLNNFSPDKKSRDGLGSYCKACKCQQSKEWRQKNRERANINKSTYAQKNPEKVKRSKQNWSKNNPEYHTNYQITYYPLNKHRILETGGKWSKGNREKRQETAKRWYYSHPLEARELANRRRDLQNRNPVSYAEVLERDGYVCHICGKTVELNKINFDHIAPISKGGRHEINNIAVSHAFCNQSKGNKTMAEYREYISRCQ